MALHINKPSTEEVMEYANELIEDRLCEHLEELTVYEKKHCLDIIDDLARCIETLYQKARQAQEVKNKGRIKFLSIYYMKSFVLTGKDPIMFYLYDENWYMDRQECSASWSADFIMKYYKEDMDYVTKALEKKYICITSAQQNQVAMECMNGYIVVLAKFFDCYKELFQKIEWNQCIQKEPTIYVSFGPFMEKGQVFYELKFEEEVL